MLAYLPRLRLRTVEALLIVTALVLGFSQVWIHRFQVGVDIIAYLDVGDAYFHHPWLAAVNATWPPLYSWILGLALAVVRPTPFWEYPLVQFVDYLIFVVTLAAFHVFLREFCRHRNLRAGTSHSDCSSASSDIAVTLIAYSLFIWSSITLVKVSQTNPDMLVAAAVYLASALLLRISRGHFRRAHLCLLGAVLGVAYLAKAAMFPIAFSYLAIAFVLSPKGKGIGNAAVALVAFAVIAGPYIGVLSAVQGRFTFSDEGHLMYGYMVDGARFTSHWQGEPPARGRPVHPTRKLLDHPEVFEFATPLIATYAPQYDPAYWYQGLQLYIDWGRQLKVIARCVGEIARIFLLGLGGTLVAAIIFLFWSSAAKREVLRDILHYWYILAPGFATFGLYSLIYLEPRYIGAFVAIIALIVLQGSLRFDAALTKGAACLLVIACLVTTFGDSSKAIINLFRPGTQTSNVPWTVADRLQQLGLHQGDKITSVNSADMDVARMARLAKVRVVAEIPHWPGDAQGFWNASPDEQHKVLKIFEATGATMAISTERPRGPDSANWIGLGVEDDVGFYRTDYYVYLFRPITQRRDPTHVGRFR